MNDMSNFVEMRDNPHTGGMWNYWDCAGHYYTSIHPWCENRIGEKLLVGRGGEYELVCENGLRLQMSPELAHKWRKWREIN